MEFSPTHGASRRRESERDFGANTVAGPKLVPGRSCGACSLCCKVARVGMLEKPAGAWCRHCSPGRGACTIHEDRPSECRDFFCAWLRSPELGPQWRPLLCKMVLIRRPHQILLLIDPAHPTAWRQPPYYDELKDWACAGVRAQPRQQVLVYNKDRITIVLPNKEIDLGVVKAGSRIMVRETVHGRGTLREFDWDAYIKEPVAFPRRIPVPVEA
jgi:Fe-S-cluster containining protein